MLLSTVAATSDALAATSSRKAKTALLTELVRDAGPEQAALAAAWLAGEPRQGRIGVGWATMRRAAAAPTGNPGLTVDDVDSALSAIAGTVGPGSVAHRLGLVHDLLGRATGAEQRFLHRLLLGEMRQGALASLVVDAVADAAGVPRSATRRALMLSGELGEVTRLALTEGEPGLAAVDLEVFRPVMPMLAVTAESATDAIEAFGQAAVEWKLDGARVQVHRLDAEVRVYTRNLHDVTDRLPETVALARSFGAGSFVLDGEVLGLDADASPRAFQDTMSRFGAAEIGARTVLDAFFFDLLSLDGRSLVDEPLHVRRAALETLTEGSAVPRLVTADADEAERFAADAVQRGHEGVVVKDLASKYAAGRRGRTWRKVKPVHTLDLVVLAVEWGHGRRTGRLSNLHLGARDGEGFVMVGKTFKGLSDDLLRWQTEHFPTIQTGTDGHVVHVEPRTVVEIAVDGVQRSTRYPGGVALRFARVRGYRPDRDAPSADTLDTVRAIGSPEPRT